ncbi:hypothetical protein AB0F43_31520 [Kribbella sp. NPDC023972]|uniref:hypothetical protein n=1 Tax=Kribbella sp. NPDC023972 TaxID=3154795 RepID=UPI00340E167A
MTYTDAQGRPELIAGDFLKKSSGSATTTKDRSDDTQKDSPAKNERKPEADR